MYFSPPHCNVAHSPLAFRLRKYTGQMSWVTLSFWNRFVSMTSSVTHTKRVNGEDQSGAFITAAYRRCISKLLKASSHDFVYTKSTFFFNKAYSGVAKVVKDSMVPRKYLTAVRRLCTPVTSLGDSRCMMLSIFSGLQAILSGQSRTLVSFYGAL